MTEITLMVHQDENAVFWQKHPRMFNHDDTGTGKTMSALAGYRASIKGRLLVIAPLTILRCAWGQDTDKYLPNFSWAVAHGTPQKRMDAFTSTSDIVLINHDGVNWLAENLDLLSGFSHCVVDEYTAFKNRATKRSKAMYKVASSIESLCLMSGTPNSNKITDLWFPSFLLDEGVRLGNNFFKFQQSVCEGRSVPGVMNAVEWVEKDGARDVVANLLRDITIRHSREDCIDIPKNRMYTLQVDMPPAVMKQYKELQEESILALDEGLITAVHAGSRTKKILQLLSGAVYDTEGQIVKVHPHRYKLVMDLVEARTHCLVAFNWKHERNALVYIAKERGIPYAVIDGDTPPNTREEIVDDYQAGKYQVVFAHPQSAGHGLTMTKGVATIWASPTYNAEHFQQLNARIDRKGQTHETETICICASNTKEEDVYEKLNGKLSRMSDLLALFAANTKLTPTLPQTSTEHRTNAF
jgi:SNF2 family DNA or RNA helicase